MQWKNLNNLEMMNEIFIYSYIINAIIKKQPDNQEKANIYDNRIAAKNAFNLLRMNAKERIELQLDQEYRFLSSAPMTSKSKLRNPLAQFREFRKPIKFNDGSLYRLPDSKFAEYKKQKTNNLA